jgi:hypothetical protein
MNNTSSTRRSSLRAGLAVAALAAGLASPLAFARGHFIGETVIVAPPLAQVEVMGEPPHRGYIYENGYWNWDGGRHVWIAGHWMAPRRGYYREPHVWVHEGNGWRMREGYWARR